MRRILIICALAFSSLASAALPPLYQTSNEIKAVLANPEFDQKLHSGEVIESIQKMKRRFSHNELQYASSQYSIQAQW